MVCICSWFINWNFDVSYCPVGIFLEKISSIFSVEKSINQSLWFVWSLYFIHCNFLYHVEWSWRASTVLPRRSGTTWASRRRISWWNVWLWTRANGSPLRTRLSTPSSKSPHWSRKNSHPGPVWSAPSPRSAAWSGWKISPSPNRSTRSRCNRWCVIPTDNADCARWSTQVRLKSTAIGCSEMRMRASRAAPSCSRTRWRARWSSSWARPQSDEKVSSILPRFFVIFSHSSHPFFLAEIFFDCAFYMDRPFNWLIDWLIIRLIIRLIDWLIAWLIDRLIDWLIELHFIMVIISSKDFFLVNFRSVFSLILSRLRFFSSFFSFPFFFREGFVFWSHLCDTRFFSSLVSLIASLPLSLSSQRLLF